ncbi:GlxA family transcriptional regulator [Arthrobacter sp. AB6]|uniref:GlxA family transcriptional regulator n=1 Tax=Arthrobacter sp. AB6 TaxID=2962570 RepID=UPI0028814A4F|nr:GlxA family transcriptional regulator [Arthrobacter sp. AB6]MDT0196508.1 GlxA family transcriptional regulator [Arthrobacter sp. AB6]
MDRPLTVAFLVYDGVKLLDVCGPAEVFAEANKFGGNYSLRYFSPSGGPVRTSIGLPLQAEGDIDELVELDTLIVPGSDDLPTRPIPGELVQAVQLLHSGVRRLVAICTGAFVLAAAGLLEQRQATTHWQHAPLLAKSHPDVHVKADALFITDGRVYTSAGVSAGIDLALALVEGDQGGDVAREVARNLVLFMQRPGGQSQFSAPLSIKAPNHQPLRKVVELICARPDLDYDAQALETLVGLSSRQIARLFASELNTTPSKFVEQIRIDHAKALLAAGHSITRTAKASGFGSSESMRRIFHQRMRISPSDYRARFHSTVNSTEVSS